MKTTVELPEDLIREAEARAAIEGQTLPDFVAQGLRAFLHSKSASARVRGNAGSWARKFVGVVSLAPGETTDDVRAAYYQRKYGV